MKTILTICTCLMLSLQACNQSSGTNATASKEDGAAKIEAQIADLEKQVLKDDEVQKNAAAAKQIVTLTEQFYKDYPTHPNTPALLFKAGDVARGLRNPGKAIQLWGYIWRDYQSHAKAPEALFLQAYTFDTMLKDKERAKSYYQKFMKQFPAHELVEQARLSIAALDKSPEDLIKEFQENLKNQ